DEAAAAVRAADLVHRTPSGRCDDPVRDHLRWAMEAAAIAVIDPAVLSSLVHAPADALGDPAGRWAAAIRCARSVDALLLLPADAADGVTDTRWWLADPKDASDTSPRCIAAADSDPTDLLVDAALAMVIDPTAEAVAARLQS
ncbi:MAG: hypothetical protein ACYTEV_00615, partial [Planctomycetota bacterium]